MFRGCSTDRPWSKTLDYFKLFSQPMDRAKLLHTARYDTKLNWKNIPGKLKKTGETGRKFDVTVEKVYIIPTLMATQHARGRIEHYSPRGKPSLRVTSGRPRSVNFASAK